MENTEQTIDVIDDFKEKGLLRNNIPYVAFLTTKRIAVLQATGIAPYFMPTNKQIDNGIYWEHFKKSLEDHLDTNDAGDQELLKFFIDTHTKILLANRYTIDQLMQVDKESFSIQNQDINTITIDKEGTINIQTGKKQKKYTTNKHRIQTTITALKQIYGDKFTYTEKQQTKPTPTN